MNIEEHWDEFIDEHMPSNYPSMDFLRQKAEPSCLICKHWHRLDDDGLYHLACKTSPGEYDSIEAGLLGKHIYWLKPYEEDHRRESFRGYRFYGWCRRFPPKQRREYSVISFRSLFTRLARGIPESIAEYEFPLMPHDCHCGEYSLGKWAEEYVFSEKYRI